MIAIVDYGMGNVKSLYNAVDFLGHGVAITKNPKIIDSATHIILPGVGAFGDAMCKLKNENLIKILENQVLVKGKPFLGICLGMQLLAKGSQEHGFNPGLGWIEADVVKFSFKDNSLKIPHVGWNEITIHQESPLYRHLNGNCTFYFVHSYHMDCKDSNDITATCNYGYGFTASIKKNNILGTQFHPEKSQDNGMQLLRNFLDWNP